MHKSIVLLSQENSLLEKAQQLNLDSVFIPETTLTQPYLKAFQSKLTNIPMYVVVDCFSNFDNAEKIEDSIPLAYDEASQSLIEVNGFCPTNPKVLANIKQRIVALLELNIQGLALNDIHYPVNWYTSAEEFNDTCFCQRCISKFIDYVGDDFAYSSPEELYLLIDGSYYQEWLDFKASNIALLVKFARDLINSTTPEIKLGYFTLPWEESENRAALQRIVAQERTILTPLVDLTLPMLFYKALNKDLEWLENKVQYFWNIGAKYLPVVEDHTDISSSEFKQMLELAVQSPSFGVCLNNLDSIVDDAEKFNVLKSFYEN